MAQPSTTTEITVTTDEYQPQRVVAADWSNWFNPARARIAVEMHCRTLPSWDAAAATSPAWRKYERGMDSFITFTRGNLPTPELLKTYKAYLRSERNLSAATINAGYITPARAYLNALAEQHIELSDATMEFRATVDGWRWHIEQAADTAYVKADTTSNVAPLHRHGIRLTEDQLRLFIRQFSYRNEDGEINLQELRDFVLMYIGFFTALRVSEIAAISLNSIRSAGEGLYKIHVQGKRRNMDPVSLSPQGYSLIRTWVAIYNSVIADEDDPRYIHAHTPVWMPLTPRSGQPITDAMLDRMNPQEGMNRRSLSRIIKKRMVAFQEQFASVLDLTPEEAAQFSPHDMRRTYAAIAQANDMPLSAISAQLRHKSIATTQRYCGELTDGRKSLIDNGFDLPEALAS